MVAWLFLQAMSGWETGAGAGYMTAAAGLFVLAAVSDLLDGLAARMLNAHSKFGRLIDPIADKALVGMPLIAIALSYWQNGQPGAPVVVASTAVIVGRDILMTVIRLAAPDGEGAPVSPLAKVKTALELVVIGALLVAWAGHLQLQAAGAGPQGLMAGADVLNWIWISLLAVTAGLSAYTAAQYLRRRPPG